MTDPSSLQEMAAVFGCDIALDRAELLLTYLDAMLQQNEHINLTAVRDRETAVLFHALDSLAMGSSTFALETESCLDLGTGNGFPGVAIACLFPQAKVTLMDRTLKKLRAIELALGQAGFDPEQIQVLQLDAAAGPAHGHRASFNLITTRAVGSPKEMAQLSAPMLKRGGSLLCWLSSDTNSMTTLPKGMRKEEELAYSLPAPADRQRRLVRYGTKA